MSNNNNNNNNNNRIANNGLDDELLLDIPMQKEDKKATKERTFITNIWGKIAHFKEKDLKNASRGIIGKYWSCAQTIYFGVRPNKSKGYETKEEAKKHIALLYDLCVEGDFYIAQDLKTGKFFIRS